MNKVVYNNCYGGFGLSAKAIAHILRQNKPDIKLYFYKRFYDDDCKEHYSKSTVDEAYLVSLKDFGDCFSFEDYNDVELQDNLIYDDQVITSRHDPRLIKAIEELKEEADGRFSELKIAEIDSDVYIIHEYDGLETVVTPEDIDWIKIK